MDDNSQFMNCIKCFYIIFMSELHRAHRIKWGKNRNYFFWHQLLDKSLTRFMPSWARERAFKPTFRIMVALGDAVRVGRVKKMFLPSRGSKRARERFLKRTSMSTAADVKQSGWSSLVFAVAMSSDKKKSEIVFFCRWHFNKSYLNLCFRRRSFCISRPPIAQSPFPYPSETEGAEEDLNIRLQHIRWRLAE